jgi:hypothetical protein
MFQLLRRCRQAPEASLEEMVTSLLRKEIATVKKMLEHSAGCRVKARSSYVDKRVSHHLY